MGTSALSLPPPHLFITLFERCLRFLQRIGQPLIWRRDWPPRTCLRDLLQEPPPLRFPDDHLAIDATDDRVIDHGVIVVAPIARVPAFDAGLGARFAEEQGHSPSPRIRTYRERNQGASWFPEWNQCNSCRVNDFRDPARDPLLPVTAAPRWLVSP